MIKFKNFKKKNNKNKQTNKQTSRILIIVYIYEENIYIQNKSNRSLVRVRVRVSLYGFDLRRSPLNERSFRGNRTVLLLQLLRNDHIPKTDNE